MQFPILKTINSLCQYLPPHTQKTEDVFTIGDGHFLQATFYRIKQHHATTMDQDGVRERGKERETDG